MVVTRTAIALGSNLGDRLATLRTAVARIDAVTPVLARSPVYETAPVGGPPQPDYLNAAVLVDWAGEPLALLDGLQAIELELGRVREPLLRNGPRTIDLDILWMQNTSISSERLVVPHPRLNERAFALRPLLDIVPDAQVRAVDDPTCRLSPYILT